MSATEYLVPYATPLFSGVNRALRSSHLRESRSTSTPDDLSELGPNQNILELFISEATLQVRLHEKRYEDCV